MDSAIDWAIARAAHRDPLDAVRWLDIVIDGLGASDGTPERIARLLEARRAVVARRRDTRRN